MRGREKKMLINSSCETQPIKCQKFLARLQSYGYSNYLQNKRFCFLNHQEIIILFQVSNFLHLLLIIRFLGSHVSLHFVGILFLLVQISSESADNFFLKKIMIHYKFYGEIVYKRSSWKYVWDESCTGRWIKITTGSPSGSVWLISSVRHTFGIFKGPFCLTQRSS